MDERFDDGRHDMPAKESDERGLVADEMGRFLTAEGDLHPQLAEAIQDMKENPSSRIIPLSEALEKEDPMTVQNDAAFRAVECQMRSGGITCCIVPHDGLADEVRTHFTEHGREGGLYMMLYPAVDKDELTSRVPVYTSRT